ncbi:hypothetical protein PROFUN_01018 [Planoprotostelium fungivorum]|uniref:PAN2-PAN3 deadenylation complex subunit PAN3 n=1 Tax=Planoprotostelium fungivorum TaxID=1890364 RepID=A0A2P6N4G5_9EUKA|nr:hypothetical protein PROFUN_01018 [Planoprotostelium fungivorum]
MWVDGRSRSNTDVNIEWISKEHGIARARCTTPYFSTTGNCFYGNQCNFQHSRVPEEQPPSSSTSAGRAAKAQITCRNIAIHGFCKFKDKEGGCEYNHDAPRIISESPTKKNTMEYSIPSLQPLTLSFDGGNADDTNNAYPRRAPFYGAHEPLNYNQPPPNPVVYTEAAYGKRKMHTFFMDQELRRALLSKGLIAHETLPTTGEISKNLPSTTLTYADSRKKDIPNTVGRYSSLFPLDEVKNQSHGSHSTSTMAFGYPTNVYKCISQADGKHYVIRKIEDGADGAGFRLANETPLRMGETWKQVIHPSVVRLHEIFISRDFGDSNAVFFAYQYFPASETLESRYISNNHSIFPVNDPLPESVIWSCILQIFSALKHIHSLGLAVRCITPSKILITQKNRFRLSGIAVHDVISFDTNKSLITYQAEDYVALGQLALFLATRSTSAALLPTNFSLSSDRGGVASAVHKILEGVGAMYSTELKNLIGNLLGKIPNMLAGTGGAYPVIEDMQQILCNKLWAEAESLYCQNDYLEGELYKETENGRLFRLLVRLGFINERPEHDMDPTWSETGDRYLLKLFRDYVFHQVYEDQSPVVDYAHVVECLNKLDVGADEKIVLTSRDEQSVLVVSYRDLKRCVMESFSELINKKGFNYAQPYHGYNR